MNQKPQKEVQLNFSQRYGHEEYETPLPLKKLSSNLRHELWNSFYSQLTKGLKVKKDGMFIDQVLADECREFVIRVLANYQQGAHYKIEKQMHQPEKVYQIFNGIILNKPTNEVLDLLEYIVNDAVASKGMISLFETLFDKYGADYWLDGSNKPYRFYERTSREDEAVRYAMHALGKSGMEQGLMYLHKSKRNLRSQRYAEAVVSSMRAVESVAIKIALAVFDEKVETLGEALKILQGKGFLDQGMLLSALLNLHAFSMEVAKAGNMNMSSQQPTVTKNEAFLLFGTSASFAGYLAAKYRE